MPLDRKWLCSEGGGQLLAAKQSEVCCLPGEGKNLYMKPYECKITINAPPAKVYAALTTPEGLRGWWTTDCEVGDGPGSQSTFRFGKTTSVVRIEKLVPQQEVRWHCVEYFLDFSMVSKTDEWVGTSMVFNLTAASAEGTDLHFVHDGLTPDLECYALCEGGWDHFLKTSLKKFLETGKGEPYNQDYPHSPDPLAGTAEG